MCIDVNVVFLNTLHTYTYLFYSKYILDEYKKYENTDKR